MADIPQNKPGVQPGGKFFEEDVKGGEPGNLVPQTDPGTGGSLPPVRPPGVTPGKQFFGHPASGGVTTLPLIFSISPNGGRTGGGTAFTIIGDRFDFVNGASVTIGGVPCTGIVVVDVHTITGFSPALAEGVYDVVVINYNGQTGTLVQGWTATAAHILQLSLTRGLTTGGTALTIMGTGFVAGSTVAFGGIAATGVIVIDSQNIYAVTPAHTRGVVDVTVTDPGPGAVATGANMFTYSDAIFGQDIRRSPSIVVTDTLNNGPKTAEFTIGGAGARAGAPPIGKEKVVLTDAGNVIFVGQVDTVAQSFESTRENLIWKVTATDLTGKFNRKRPFGTYVNTRADIIANDLITRYAPEFNGAFVQSNLPQLNLILDGSQDMATVFTNIALACGEGHWYIDYFYSVHLFVLATNLGNNVPPPTVVSPPPNSGMVVSNSATSVSGYSWVPGWYTFQCLFFYAGSNAAGPNAKTYDQISENQAQAFKQMALQGGASSCDITRKTIDGTPSLPAQFSVNFGPGFFQNDPTRGVLVNWIELSREAAARNLLGDIPVGAYGATTIPPFGWTCIIDPASVPPAGGPFPAPGGAPLAAYFASFDVARSLELASGGAGTPAVAAFQGGLGALSNIFFLSSFLPAIANIPIGPTVGGRVCTARQIVFTRLADSHQGGGTPTTGYIIINDNTTTSLSPAIPAFFSYGGPTGATTPPAAPAAQINLADSGIANDLTIYPGVPGITGSYAVEVTGVYQDGTESLGCEASNTAALIGSNMATVSNLPIFPTINTVPCVYRKIYMSQLQADGSATPDFTFQDTACVFVVTDNASGSVTFPFGGNITGGNSSPPNLPPGSEPELGIDLESPFSPVPITENNTLTLNDPAPEFTSDTTQLRNRIYIKGRGTNIVQDAKVGAKQIFVTDISSFSPTGGFAIIGSRIISYYGTSIDTSSGLNALLLNSGLTQAITQSDWTTGGTLPILPFIQVDDVASQKFYGALELDADGNQTDGIHEHTITDNTLTSQPQMVARGLAELKQFARPIVTLRFSTRDPKAKAGRVVHVDIKSPPMKGDFIIQSVRIDQFHDQSNKLAPRYNVFADSAARFTFNDLLLKLSENLTIPADGSFSGTIDSAVTVVNGQTGLSSTIDFDVWGSGSTGTLQSDVQPMTFSLQRGGTFPTIFKRDALGLWTSGAVSSGQLQFVQGNTTFVTLSRLFDITWRVRTPTTSENNMFAFPVGGNPNAQAGNQRIAFGIGVSSFAFPINTAAQRMLVFMYDQGKNNGYDFTRWVAAWVDESGSNGTIISKDLLPATQDTVLICRLRVVDFTDVNTGRVEWTMTNELTGESVSQIMRVVNNANREYEVCGELGVITAAAPPTVMWFNHMHVHVGIV